MAAPSLREGFLRTNGSEVPSNCARSARPQLRSGTSPTGHVRWHVEHLGIGQLLVDGAALLWRRDVSMSSWLLCILPCRGICELQAAFSMERRTRVARRGRTRSRMCELSRSCAVAGVARASGCGRCVAGRNAHVGTRPSPTATRDRDHARREYNLYSTDYCTCLLCSLPRPTLYKQYTQH